MIVAVSPASNEAELVVIAIVGTIEVIMIAYEVDAIAQIDQFVPAPICTGEDL